MSSGVTFPLYVFEKDDWSMRLVEAPDRVLHHMEAIDIEGNEYLFWDANGRGVRVSIGHKNVIEIAYDDATDMSLAQAFSRHADALDVKVDITGPAAEVWARLKKAETKSRKQGLLSKLLDRRTT